MVLNEKARETILNGMKPFMDECGFKEKDGYYTNDKRSFSVDYDESRRQFILNVAEVRPDDFDGAGAYSEQAAWLFDEHHDEKDAELIAQDFCDTLRGLMGMKVAFASGMREVSLPNKAAPGTTPGIEAFAQRFLTLFPQYKETYKDELAQRGEFLYDHFFSSYAVPLLREYVQQNNKKQIKKMFDMLEDYYSEGDRVVTSTISYSILSEALGTDEALWKTAEEYMGNTPLLKQNGQHIRSFLETSRKYDKFKFWKKQA